MTLNNTQIRFLREQAHHLMALVRIGDNGLSPEIIKEINKVLSHHELVKIKIPGGDKASKQAIIADIVEQTDSDVIQSIGNTVTLYRANPDEPKIMLPK